jgi:hypothetical protein
MNADEAAKCLLVARRLLAQAQRGEGDVHACLERALKYAEKSKRLDASLTSASDDLASALRRARRDPTFGRGSQGARASGSGDRGGGSGGGGGGARARVAVQTRGAAAERQGHAGPGSAHGAGETLGRLLLHLRHREGLLRRGDQKGVSKDRDEASPG